MLGSAVLEVAVGIMFVFLLVSLICSEVGSQVSSALKWRAVELEKGICDLIMGGDLTKLQALYAHPLIQALAPRPTVVQRMLAVLPWLRGRADALPVHIPPRTFVLAMFNAFVPNSAGMTTVKELHQAVSIMPDSPLKDSLLALVSAGDTQVETARTNVEEWFNAAMERVTEIYKVNMWRLALFVGLAVSVILNIDAIAITSNLWRDPSLRIAVSAAAQRYELNQQYDQAQIELNQLNLPIGWQVTSRSEVPGFEIVPADWVVVSPDFSVWTAAVLKLIGWLLTGLAGAQGAPFWFDMLKKLTSRAS